MHTSKKKEECQFFKGSSEALHNFFVSQAPFYHYTWKKTLKSELKYLDLIPKNDRIDFCLSLIACLSLKFNRVDCEKLQPGGLAALQLVATTICRTAGVP